MRSTWVREQLARAGRWILPIEHRKGVLFIGYAEGNLGIGQCFRNDVRAAAHANLPFAIYPFSVGIKSRLLGPFMPERYDKTHTYDVNVIEVAPDQVPAVLLRVDFATYARHLQRAPHLLGVAQRTEGLGADAGKH